MIIELIVLCVVGVVCVVMGWEIWKKEKITMIHSYHYKNVKDKDKKEYTTEMGKGILIIGVGCIIAGVFNYFMNSAGGWIFFGSGFICGFLLMINAQKKYNGGLF